MLLCQSQKAKSLANQPPSLDHSILSESPAARGLHRKAPQGSSQGLKACNALSFSAGVTSPPGDVWQHPETFVVVSLEEVLLAFSR